MCLNSELPLSQENFLRQLNDWCRWDFLEFRVAHERGHCPRDAFLEASPAAFFPCCLWSTITAQTAVSKGVFWSRGISAVSVPLLEAPLKPLLRMPAASNSKSNNWSELGNSLACWHFNKRQLQHSLLTLRLPAPSVWSSKASSPEKQSPAFLVPGLGSSLPFCVVSLLPKARRSLFNVS